MADYYPLLAKAVAGLPKSTPDARRSIYERSRKALLGQLRSLDPPVPEAVIEREARALEEAIARLEVDALLDAPAIDGATAEPLASRPVEGSSENARVVPSAAATPTAPAADVEPVASDGQGAEPATAPSLADSAAQGGSSEDARRPTDLSLTGLGRKEIRRPSVPVPARKPPVPKRLWIVGAVVLAVVALVAILAYVLRDRPEDLVRPPAGTQSSTTDEGAGGKIVDRVGSGEARPIETTSPPMPLVTHAPVPKPSLPQAEPPAAVARRAALLIEAPEEQSKVKTYLGTVVWRVDNVNNGPGEPLGVAVRAEIDIPEEKLQAAMTLQKNTDSTLPASHTMKLRFVIQPGAAIGSVTRINVPYMRREDTATGDALNGVPVPIMENSFLVGLAKGPAEATNLDLLRTREWLDVPMVFANGRIAKLTFEKGTSGQRLLEDALKSWEAQ